MIGNMYKKNYKMTGLTFHIMKLNPMDPVYKGVWIPVLIKAEYPKYLLAEVLPHQNPNGQRVSKPYNITIHKHDLFTKQVRIK